MQNTNRLGILAEFWWIRIPRAMRSISAPLASAFTDGFHLSFFPFIGSWGPVVVFLVSLYIGWQHPGFTSEGFLLEQGLLRETVFTQSLLIIALFTLIGITSAHLGLWSLMGFALGDFVLREVQFSPLPGSLEGLGRYRLHNLIEYAVLGALLVNIPIATKMLVVQLRPPLSLSRPVRFAIGFVLHVLVTAALVFFWTQATPLLIRPIFTWTGYGFNPPVSAMSALQTQWIAILSVAVGASILRMSLQYHMVFSRYQELQAQTIKLRVARPTKPWIERVPLFLRLLFLSIWLTFLLAGMLDTWVDAVLMGGLIFVLQALRTGWIPFPLKGYAERMNRIPVLVRMMAGLVITFLLVQPYLTLSGAFEGTGAEMLSFRPMLISTAIGMVIFFLLHPGQPAQKVKRR